MKPYNLGNDAEHHIVRLAKQLLILGDAAKNCRNQVISTIPLLEASNLGFKRDARLQAAFLRNIYKFKADADRVACDLVAFTDDPRNICCRVFFGAPLSELEREQYLGFVRSKCGA